VPCLHGPRADPQIHRMLICTAEGPRSIDPTNVIAIYRGGGDGRYTYCTLILLVGTGVSGAISNDSLATFESWLGDDTPLPPPLAA
jgi:hypothetical protein